MPVLTPHTVTRLFWCYWKTLMEPDLPPGRLFALLPLQMLLKLLLCNMGMGSTWGIMGAKACLALHLLPLVSQQLPGTPCVELRCSQDFALQCLFSVLFCQPARVPIGNASRRRETELFLFFFFSIYSFFFFRLVSFHLNVNRILQRKDIRT